MSNSLNVTLNREQPALKLSERHPYIASRVNQAIEARDAAGPDCSVAVLEIPYVFGATPNRASQFAYMRPWLSGNSRLPLMAPPGGTAVVSAAAIGVAPSTLSPLDSRGTSPWHKRTSPGSSSCRVWHEQLATRNRTTSTACPPPRCTP